MDANNDIDFEAMIQAIEVSVIEPPKEDEAPPDVTPTPILPPPRELPAHKKLTITRVHVCKTCNHTFSTRYLLWQHKWTEHPDEPRPAFPFKCKYCVKEFKSHAGFIRHQSNHISINSDNEMIFKCIRCTEVFKDAASLQKHVQIHGYRDRTDKRVLINPLTERADCFDKTFFCSFCSLKYLNEDSRDQHERHHVRENYWENLGSYLMKHISEEMD